MNKKAVFLLINNNVKKIMESKNFGTQYEVGDEDKKYIVEIINKKGSNFIRCTCKQGSIHPIGNPICSHKLSVILFCQREVFQCNN